MSDIYAVYVNGARALQIEPLDQLRNRAFTAAASADYAYTFAWFYVKADIF